MLNIFTIIYIIYINKKKKEEMDLILRDEIISTKGDTISTDKVDYDRPSVIRLLKYVYFPYKKVTLSRFNIYRTPINHQSMVYGIELFESNSYDTEFEILADYELALKYYLITLKIDKEFPIENDTTNHFRCTAYIFFLNLTTKRKGFF